MEIMNHLNSPQSIMERMRDPLSLKVMRNYFNLFSRVDQKDTEIMEEQFTSRYCTVNLSDNDHFAFAALSSIFRVKLKKMRKEEKQEVKRIELQNKYQDQTYRVIRQGVIQRLATGRDQQV
jgi:cellulose biosynthesis protein BcsQ